MPPAEHPADLPSDDMTATAAPGLLLGPMLRHVDRTSATIWVETDAPCAVEVCGRTSPTFTVHGHHYALVLVDELEPGSTTPYEVALDGVRRWPIDGSTLPASTIRTIGSEHGDRPVRLAFGSCRASAPHVPPYTSRLDDHPDGRAVDEWPDLLLMAGDQVYADDSSPGTAARLERRRSNVSTSTPPDGVVADFEEYTLLYRESWTPEIERWLFSTVPSAMQLESTRLLRSSAVPERIALPVGQELLLVEVADIQYFESDGAYVSVFINGQTKPVILSKSLREFEELLNNPGFFRAHNSFLVNLRFIKKIIRTDGGELVMANGRSLPVARAKKGELMELIAKV